MFPSFDAWTAVSVAADVAAAANASAESLAARRSRRLAALLGAASHRSPIYRRLLAGRTLADVALDELPVMRKAELMRRFDEWVGDPAIRLPDLRRFMADPANIGRPFLDRYTVWESSGSSGEPAVFVQDASAMAVYDALESLRRPAQPLLQRWFDPWGLAERVVFLGATGGHFASAVSIERLRRLQPWLAARLLSVSFMQPVGDVVAELQARRPSVVATYPSAAVMIAEEQVAGRLHIAPREIWTGGETLTPAMRVLVEQAFGCRVLNSYGASEFLSLAAECASGALHLNSDWAILEAVDARGQPVPAGTFGVGALLTNLANHVQPLIRYDLGDRIAVHDTRCACGSHLPVVEVLGRCDDTLRLGTGARRVSVLPLALCTVVEEEAGLFDFQIVQTGSDALSLSCGAGGAAAAARLRRAETAVRAFLAQQGAGAIRILCRTGQPGRLGRTGKRQRVVAMAA